MCRRVARNLGGGTPLEDKPGTPIDTSDSEKKPDHSKKKKKKNTKRAYPKVWRNWLQGLEVAAFIFGIPFTPVGHNVMSTKPVQVGYTELIVLWAAKTCESVMQE